MSDGEPTRLLDLWQGADLAVVVDAVRTVTPRPGTVHRRSLRHPSTRATGQEPYGPGRPGSKATATD